MGSPRRTTPAFCIATVADLESGQRQRLLPDFLMRHYTISADGRRVVFVASDDAGRTPVWLAALNVRYRDVKYTIPFLIQLGLFVTPVIYPKTLMPQRVQQLLVLNPLAGIIEGFRACLLPQQRIDFSLIAGSAAVGAFLFVASGLYFRSTERAFADIV